MHVLLVEDEQSIADNILYALQLDGFLTAHTSLGNEALTLLAQTPFDLVILDVGLPDINGFELCKKIRLTNQVPIIFLTARNHEIDTIVGLEIGGDDYMTKPFSPRELVARVKTVLKRTTTQKATGKSDTNLTTKGTKQVGHFEYNHDTQRISYYGTYMDLTRYEYGLMTSLLTQPERVFSRDQLMQAVWPDSCESFDRVIDTHIKSLRAKLKKIHNHDDPIKTHRGLGYSLALQDD